MTKPTKRKKKPAHHRQQKHWSSESHPLHKEETWVDRIAFRSILPEDYDNDKDNGTNDDDIKTHDSNGVSLSIICWNVLAEGYCSPTSHRGLPREYQEVVFDKYRRGSLIHKTLTSESLTPDVWALQEVDMDEIMAKHLKSKGYQGVETPRMKIGGGAGGKVDSCGLYYLHDKWTLLDHEFIRLDDLATLSSNEDCDLGSINNNLQGLQRSFLRRNMGMLIRLQSKISPQTTIVLVNTHLFWNPLYDYVKLCQMHYVIKRAQQFLKHPTEPFVLCGDFNSLPGNSVHAYLSKGVIDANIYAPWYQAVGSGVPDDDEEEKSINGLSKDLSSLAVQESGMKQPQARRKQEIRYLLDCNLNRLCRWFRILGLDAALETEDEEKSRTKEGNMKLFDRCRSEHRVLITTSTTLLNRQNCPPGTYLVTPKSLKNNWEIVLVHILITHGVVLDPRRFLTRCVVCNGDICAVHDEESKQKIFEDYQAPLDATDDLAVYQCNGCQQGYWWCDRPTSSASRVKCQATKLYQMCLQGQVPVVEDNEKHMFSHVDPMEEREKGWDWSVEGSTLLKLSLQITDWLKMRDLKCPIWPLESAYKDENSSTGECIPFTNVTSDFEGLLDYIFFDCRSLEATERLYVPVTHEELNSHGFKQGHLLPSYIWPSDHLAIGVTLRLRSTANNQVKNARENKSSNTIVDFPVCAPIAGAVPPPVMQVNPSNLQHNPENRRCACGCVPAVLSLFEMAELRKQARLKKEAEKARAG